MLVLSQTKTRGWKTNQSRRSKSIRLYSWEETHNQEENYVKAGGILFHKVRQLNIWHIRDNRVIVRQIESPFKYEIS